MKKAISLILGLALTAGILPLSSCAKDSGKMKLEFIGSEGEKTAKFSLGKEEWSGVEGAFGIRLSYDDVANVSDTEYVKYSSVEKVGETYIAKAIITTEDGSEFAVEDAYTEREGDFEIVRDFQVVKAGSAQGFMTYYPLQNNRYKAAEDRLWFSPSNYYGNTDITFTGTGVKSGFYEESTVTADMVSTPVVLNYLDGYAFSIMDKTEGMRETISADATAEYNTIYVNENLNIPGIGLKNTETEKGMTVTMYHAYPCNTHNYLNIRPYTNNYRMLPIREGLARQTGFVVSLKKDKNFDNAIQDSWRKSYDAYAVKDTRYAPYEVFKACAEYVDRSFDVVGGIPQYMTKTDHYYPESGFLYRNADLGYLMLRSADILGNDAMRERAIRVIDSQVENDYIDENITHEFDRSTAEGLENLLDAYVYLKEKGTDKRNWLAYLLGKVEACSERESRMYLPFLIKAGKVFHTNEYYELAIDKVADLEEAHNRYEFTDAIVNFTGTSMVEREAAMIYFKLYLELYDYTKDTKYLDLAKKAAFVCESYTMIQAVSLETFDGTGYEYKPELDNRFREYGGLGNSQVMPYGLSFITGQTSSTDIFIIWCAENFRELSEITKDDYYADFSEYLLSNCLLTINMGDKNWLMDDIRYSQGKGFMNEYVGIGASTDPVSAGRGSMHISNLAWNEYVVLYALLQENDRNPEFFKREATDFDLAANKYVHASSQKNGAYRAYNATDKTETTAWSPAADDQAPSLTVDLNELAQLSSVSIKSKNTTSFDVLISADGINFTPALQNTKEGGNLSDVARYVRLEIKNYNGNSSVEDFKIMGKPVVGQDVAPSASITTDGGQDNISAVNDQNYSTVWHSDKNSCVVTLDLGEEKEIVETVIMFDLDVTFINQDQIQPPATLKQYSYKVEVSSDGENWTVFADRSQSPLCRAVFSDKNYSRAKYVRLTAQTTGTKISITDFKIRCI